MDLKALSHISSENVYQLIANELQGVVITDELGRYVYVNNHWSAMTGMTLERVKGKYVHDVVLSSRVDYVIQTKKFLSGDAVLLNARTNEEVPVYCSYTPLFEEDRLLGCFIYMIQKSEQKAMDIPPNVVTLMEKLNGYLKQLGQSQGTKYSLNDIVGNSGAIQRMKDNIIKVARSASTVLIEGETGSGKELVAHTIHNLSPRFTQPFIKVNCAAIPKDLIESEFFGYEQGSFTGAQRGGKSGKFELANGGSLFLDEVNQAPMFLQPKLLRVLQEHEVERIGGSHSIPVDTRIVAATNVSLDHLVREGLFRSDLFYRLNVIRIHVPALRERPEDIPLLANHILEQLNYELHLQIPGIEDDAMQRLMDYSWPGNVRELHNVIERAMNLSWCEPLRWEHFADYFEQAGLGDHRKKMQTGSMREQREENEKKLLADTLQRCNGNKACAAEELGISRTILYKKLHQFGLM